MKKLLVIHHVQPPLVTVADIGAIMAKSVPTMPDVEMTLSDLVPGLPIGALKSHESILNAARTIAMCGYPDIEKGIWIAPSQIKNVEIVFE